MMIKLNSILYLRKMRIKGFEERDSREVAGGKEYKKGVGGFWFGMVWFRYLYTI